MLDWAVKLRRSSGEDVLKGRRGVTSVSKLLSLCERVESRRGRLAVPGVTAVGLRNCLLGLEASMTIFVGDVAALRRAAKRVRSASGIAEKALMSFMVSSMLRVISVSSTVSCSLVPGLSGMMVLIPSSTEARRTVVSSSSSSAFLGDSTARVNASLNWNVDSDGDSVWG